MKYPFLVSRIFVGSGLTLWNDANALGVMGEELTLTHFKQNGCHVTSRVFQIQYDALLEGILLLYYKLTLTVEINVGDVG